MEMGSPANIGPLGFRRSKCCRSPPLMALPFRTDKARQVMIATTAIRDTGYPPTANDLTQEGIPSQNAA
jgi:hypothetical protein